SLIQSERSEAALLARRGRETGACPVSSGSGLIRPGNVAGCGDRQARLPMSAVVHFQRERNIAGGAQFCMAGPVGLEKKGCRVRGGGLVDLDLMPSAGMIEERSGGGKRQAVGVVGCRADTEPEEGAVVRQRDVLPGCTSEDLHFFNGTEPRAP